MATQTVLNPIDGRLISEAIRSAWATFLQQGQSAPSKRSYVYASAKRDCDRRMVLDMTEGDKQPPWEAEVLANFRRGSDRERDLLSDLKRIGRISEPSFEVVGEQERFELRDRKGRVCIVGKVDARLRFSDGSTAPLEVKSWNPQTVARISAFEDLLKGTWTKSAAYQTLAYCYGSGEPVGFLLLDRAGIPLLLPVELYPNLDRMEEFLGQAERALDHLEAKTLPDYTRDAAECKRCPFFGSVCNPPLEASAATILTDPELETLLDRREELKAAADEYDSLDADVKKRLRGIESGIAGHYLIEGKWSKSTTYDIPKEVKAQYAKTDPHGRFTLAITKL